MGETSATCVSFKPTIKTKSFGNSLPLAYTVKFIPMIMYYYSL